MPWDANSFRAKHNHKLSDEDAKKASSVANALLEKGHDEGSAIAIANAMVKRKKKPQPQPKSK